MRWRHTADSGSLRCSFCQKRQDAARKLVSTPSDYPRAYICDECIAICAAIVEDDREPLISGRSDEANPLLTHPLALRLLTTVERWIRRESVSGDADNEFAEMQEIAALMFRVDGK
jgi:hypothetical protein